MSLKRHIHVRFLQTRVPANLVRPFALTVLVHFLLEWSVVCILKRFSGYDCYITSSFECENLSSTNPWCVASTCMQVQRTSTYLPNPNPKNPPHLRSTECTWHQTNQGEVSKVEFGHTKPAKPWGFWGWFGKASYRWKHTRWETGTNKIHVKNSTYMCSPETCRFPAQDCPISLYNSVGRNFGRLKIAIGISEFALPLVPLKIHDPSGHLKHSKSPSPIESPPM